MEVTGPAIRSNVERTFFGLLRELSEPMQRALEAQTAPEIYATARDARLLGWTSLDQAVGLRESLRQVLGDDDRFVATMREWALLSVRRPPFNILSEAILRIYDREPGSLLRAYARIWGTIYREVSGYAVERQEEDSALVVLSEPCPEAQTLAFRLYNLGVFMAVAELGGGTHIHGSQRIAINRVEFELRWRPGSG